jgi:hypothetical protein
MRGKGSLRARLIASVTPEPPPERCTVFVPLGTVIDPDRLDELIVGGFHLARVERAVDRGHYHCFERPARRQPDRPIRRR